MFNQSQSLWNRAVSFDERTLEDYLYLNRLNPFGTGQCLSTNIKNLPRVTNAMSQSLWNRAVSFDEGEFGVQLRHVASQSLWNRAVSFDFIRDGIVAINKSQSLWNRAVSFDVQPTSFQRRSKSQSLWNRAVSFDHLRGKAWDRELTCLNPFGTGQCLSTTTPAPSQVTSLLSQSLWNRAVSFDTQITRRGMATPLSQSLWNRAVSFD